MMIIKIVKWDNNEFNYRIVPENEASEIIISSNANKQTHVYDHPFWACGDKGYLARIGQNKFYGLFNSKEDALFYLEKVRDEWIVESNRHFWSLILDEDDANCLISIFPKINFSKDEEAEYKSFELPDKRILELDLWRGEGILFQDKEAYNYVKDNYFDGPDPYVIVI